MSEGRQAGQRDRRAFFQAVPEPSPVYAVYEKGERLGKSWKKTLELVRERSTHALLLGESITRWRRAESSASFLAALTTGSSAVAGWSFWNDDDWRTVWVVLAGFATVLSLAVTHIGVPGKIRDLEAVWKRIMEVNADGKRLLDQIDFGHVDREQAELQYVELKRKSLDIDRDFKPGLIPVSSHLTQSGERALSKELREYDRQEND